MAKAATPTKPVKPPPPSAQALKLAAKRQKLANASMLQAQNAVVAAVQGIAQIVHGRGSMP